MILPSDLEGQTLAELRSLYAVIERELFESSPGSAQRRKALASLENVRRAINARSWLPYEPGPGP